MASRKRKRKVIARVWHNNGLSLTLFALFALTLIGQITAGWRDENNERELLGRPLLDLSSYIFSGTFLEVTMENWESEFLQMFAYVVLTIFLFQKGSSESKDPDDPEEPEPPLTAKSPAAARAGGWRRRIYENSMSLAFLALFLMSFVLHAVGGHSHFNEELLLHGRETISLRQYLMTSRFWFESLQNWQSEFLSIWAMVVLSIFLRQKGSPESKGINSPHSETGR